MESIKKFNDLKSGSTYAVQGYEGPKNSKFGFNYILLIKDTNSNEMYEVWSTNLLAEYISQKSPKDKFTFTVQERNGHKYPVIDNYRKPRQFTMLQ